MTETQDAVARRVPWHFWLVCGVAVLWNGYGGYDYVMSLARGDAYMTGMGMTEEQVALFHAMPAWMYGAWTLGVWGAVIGTVLLLLRSRFAFAAFVASLVGQLLSLVYSYGLSDTGKLMGQGGAIMAAVITAGCLFFIGYSRRMATAGVLR